VADLPTPSLIRDLAGLLAPGMIILGVMSRFASTQTGELKDKIITYGVASVAYTAAVSPLFHASQGVQLPTWLWSLLQFFIVPLGIGIAAAYISQREWLYLIAKKVGLRLAHHTPTAWDYAFRNMVSASYVIVKLHNGSEFAGLMGKQSFASTNPGERDLLIQEVWKIPEGGEWERVEPVRAALICGKDIQSVEIFSRN
jgi:hypothetical protein